VAKTLYFDCFSGASGDMVLGALLDLGLPLESLRSALGSLAIEYGGVSAGRVLRAGVSATKFHVHADERAAVVASGVRTAGEGHSHSHDHPHDHSHPHSHDHSHPHSPDHPNRESQIPSPQAGIPSPAAHSHHSLAEIAGYIGRSALSAPGKERAVHLFERLASAEAAIHAMPVEKVHLHEVGALDSIIDIVGAVHGLEWLGATTVRASALNVGSGTVQCAHGTFPVPAPATVRLLQGVPIYSGAVAAELVTPTGALIVSDYASEFGPLPQMRVDAVGYGAGARDFNGNPNVLRLLVGESDLAAAAERIVSIECEIDDMNPQLFGPLMDRLTEAGALDVFYGAVQMKKNRPGTLVTVLAPPDRREAIAGVLFTHTTTIGIRYLEMLRDRLDRELRAIETPLGVIRFKVATRAGRVLNAAAEFEDCARVAAERHLPIKDVQAIATKAWLDSQRQ
jgi:pyridinium-3,5-bisthiocarboxylic acid mononucleotide nickel chelatase